MIKEYSECPSCPKCGAIATWNITDGDTWHTFYYQDGFDLVHVTCWRCEYSWQMEPKEKKGSTSAKSDKKT